jgi:transposase
MTTPFIKYFGLDIYVGIDVHKKSYSIVARFNGEILKKATVPADQDLLSQSLKRWFPNAQIHSVYEAGFCGFNLDRHLRKQGIDNIVVNPSSVEVAANDKKKCDRRDANKLSEQREAKRLHGIYVPTVEEELARQITRTREQLVCERKRVGNKIKSKLTYFGYIKANDDRIFGSNFIHWIKSLELPRELRWSLELLIKNWELLAKQVKEIEVDMQIQAFESPEIELVYRSVPGVGPIAARVLANELGDLSKRFHSQDALFQYTGLTPSEHSSGEHIRKGHIDRQGSARIRHILTQIAWKAIAKDAALKEFFDKLSVRRGKKIAIVAVARKLIGRIRACFQKQQLYQLGLAA